MRATSSPARRPTSRGARAGDGRGGRDDRVLGALGMSNSDWADMKGEIGYWMAAEARRRGIGRARHALLAVGAQRWGSSGSSCWRTRERGLAAARRAGRLHARGPASPLPPPPRRARGPGDVLDAGRGHRASEPVYEAAARLRRSAEAYELGRPGYPAAALEPLAARSRYRVLDLAAGTGKLTRALAASGARVIAVEPVAEMRAVLPASVRGLDGTAEQIPLEDAAVDLVTVAQAFHWFDGDAGARGDPPRPEAGRPAGARVEPPRGGRGRLTRRSRICRAASRRVRRRMGRRLARGLRANDPLRAAR